jgi:hypothetical protein
MKKGGGILYHNTVVTIINIILIIVILYSIYYIVNQMYFGVKFLFTNINGLLFIIFISIATCLIILRLLYASNIVS